MTAAAAAPGGGAAALLSLLAPGLRRRQRRHHGAAWCAAGAARPPALLLLLLLLLAAAAAVLAAPPPPPAPAPARPTPVVGAAITAQTAVFERVIPAVTTPACPGVAGGVCGRACQLHLCRALATMYRESNNASDPWDNERGWELTATTPCETLVARGGPRGAVYCSWFGVTCCGPADVGAGSCTTVNTIRAVELPINNLNVSVANPRFIAAVQDVHDCGMAVLNLEANNLVDSLPDAWGDMVHLTLINMGNCWLEGGIPNSLRRLKKLQLINFNNNWLNGTLPTWLDELEELLVLNLGSQYGYNEGSDAEGLTGPLPSGLGRLTQLRQLNLEANSLTGTLPEDLCTGDDSNLLVLSVRGNQLEGRADAVEGCGSLTVLDIGGNAFTGSLPASAMWDELIAYRANDNAFTGRLPIKLMRSAHMLEYLDVSRNQLTGHTPTSLALWSSLRTMILAGNQLTGTVTENVFYLPALAQVDVSSNNFVGDIPQAVGLAYALRSADFSNNPGMTGMLPPEVGLLEDLKEVRLRNTSLSCAGSIRLYTITTNNSCDDPDRCTTPVERGDPGAATRICPSDHLLPCFLRFSDYLVPRDDSSNMRCRPIQRLPPEKAREACAGTEPTQLGDQASGLPDIAPDRVEQQWFIDPAYYQYQACECLLGYKQVWDDTHTTLRCVPDDSSFAQTQRIAIIVGVVAAVLVLAAGLFAWRQYLMTRPRWLRERTLAAKRAKGAPKAAKPGDKVAVSIVVTDVKDFSELTRRFPELMNKAMGGHNNILRKVCHAHAGYVMEQEGDSWTVAFHDAEDAVAFSLQVQQALALKVWGMRLAGGGDVLSELRLAGLRDDSYLPSTARLSMQSSVHTNTSFGAGGGGEGGDRVRSASSGGGGGGGAHSARGGGGGGSLCGDRGNSGSSHRGDRGGGDSSHHGNGGGDSSHHGNGGGDSSHHGDGGGASAAAAASQLELSALQARPGGEGPPTTAAAAAAALAAAAAGAPSSQQQQQQQKIVSWEDSVAFARTFTSMNRSFTAAGGSAGAGGSVGVAPPGGAGAGAGAGARSFGAGGGGNGVNRSFTSPRRPLPSVSGGKDGGGGGKDSSRPTTPKQRQQQLALQSGSLHLSFTGRRDALLLRDAAGGAAARPSKAALLDNGGGGGGQPAVANSKSSFSSGAVSLAPDDVERSVVVAGAAAPGGAMTPRSSLAAGGGGAALAGVVQRRSSGGTSRQSSANSSRIWGAGASLVRRFSTFAGWARPDTGTGGSIAGTAAGEARPMQVLRLAVRIGIATGTLPYGTDVAHCVVKDRAKEFVCEVANGNQVLMDEPTFLVVKDSLSVLGTVNENGYDDKLLQAMMHAQAVDKLQSRLCCGPCDRSSRSLSFTSDRSGDRPRQDFDNDAIAVHMGGFLLADDKAGALRGHRARRSSADADGDGAAPSTPSSSSSHYTVTLVMEDAAQHAAEAVRDARLLDQQRKRQLQLYSIAAPGMRRAAESTRDLARSMGWAEAINLRSGWQQARKGYFDAPGARYLDLAPAVDLIEHPPLPEVTIVFCQVSGARSFTYKRSSAEVHALHKTMRRCILATLEAMIGRDGYLCHCQEADLRYMIAFEAPHRAVQWCLLVQEALMYCDWPPNVLSHAGFEEQLNADTGLPVFRGPRLRMGLAEGRPSSVLPDHAGCANYCGGSVNRAARFMDAAAHGGQVVTDLGLARKLFATWAEQELHDRGAESLATTEDSNVQDGDDDVAGGPPHNNLPPVRVVGSGGGDSLWGAGPTSAAAGDADAYASYPIAAPSPSSRGGGADGRGAQRQPVAVATMEVAPGWPNGGGDSAEPVTADHLGTFSFKGSGMFEMVQMRRPALAARTFPAEPPHGKGERLQEEAGPVEGLGHVNLQLLQSLLAARAAFKQTRGAAAP